MKIHCNAANLKLAVFHYQKVSLCKTMQCLKHRSNRFAFLPYFMQRTKLNIKLVSQKFSFVEKRAPNFSLSLFLTSTHTHTHTQKHTLSLSHPGRLKIVRLGFFFPLIRLVDKVKNRQATQKAKEH